MDFLYDDAESLIGFLYNGTAYYYIRNLQNDIIGILDSDGNQVVSYVYDSWGKLISTSGSLADTIGFQNPFRYRGYYYDQETGFYYLQSRYYDPETGRFLNADDSDILTEDQNDLLEHNLFAYCFNNPVNMADPSGHVAISAVIGGVLGGVTGAALGVILANMLNLKGIARGLFIAGVAVAGAALGAFLGPYVAKLMPKLLQYTKAAAKKVVKTAKSVKSKVKTKITKVPSCFVAGTLIETEDGHIPIEQIEVGDLVWAEDPETGEKGLRRVVQTFVNETDELVHVFAGGEKIVTTPEHPFYTPEFGWTSAIQLRAGDILLLSNGNYVVVEKVQHEILETPITVYNFEVEGLHTYFVGSNSILVHNACKISLNTLKDAYIKKY